MLIDLRKLLSGTEDELTVSACLDMDKFDDGLNSYEIVSKEPFELKIVKVGKSKLHIICSGSVDMNIPCDRCLKPVLTSVSFDIDDTVEMEENASEDEEPEEKDYIDGYNLDVDKLVFGEILISMPGKTLCKEDCKGICLICGANLNKGECGCDRDILDPRMSVFKDILKNFKEV